MQKLELLTGRCLIIGEVAQAHDGSLGTAHAFIDAIADAGADAVKFQTHIAEAESTPSEPWRVKFSQQDETRFEYWKRMEFTEEHWHGLKSHAEEKGLLFLSSPFSTEAIELLERVGVAAWKIASGEVTTGPLFDRMIASQLPILLSTGMSRFHEIDAAVDLVKAANLPLAVLQCTSMYPTPAEKIGLNVLHQLRERYGCAVGLSDHSGVIYPGLAAAALGAEVLEIHVTLSRQMFGPDVVASVTVDELRQLVDGIRFTESMLANPVDKEAMADDLESMRSLFSKSIVFKQDLPAGTELLDEHLTGKKPGSGMPLKRISEMIGRILVRDVRKDEQLTGADLK
ncbi:MAG: N-acetylneuraminate synthase family protein [Planctomycetota bacterium]